ncbi:hypothetical protein BGX27_008957 [Mortierella sp. AM989]|nr:hypothetical protein BGX27_008957 [Mortierella sp. AM989]
MSSRSVSSVVNDKKHQAKAIGSSTADYKITSGDPYIEEQLLKKNAAGSVPLLLEKFENVHLQLGLARNARLGPSFGLDSKRLTMELHAQSSTRLKIEIENAHKQAWKVPQSIVPRHPPRIPFDHRQSDQTLDYSVVWNDPNSFAFTVLRKESGEKLFDTSSLGLTMKDQYIEFSTRLAGGNAGRAANLYGLGENVGPLRHEPGTTTTLWARDSPCKPETNLYGCHPFYMEILPSGSAHGVLLLSSNGMDIVISPQGDQLTYKVIGGTIELYIFTGPTPQQVIQQYTELIGRSCMIPYYAQGFHICRWGYDTLEKVKDVVSNFKDNSLPLEAMWVDIDYMKDYKCFTFDEERFPPKQLSKYVEELHAQDQHIVMILDPGIKVQYQPGLYEPYDEGVAKNLFIKRRVTKPEETEDGTKYHAGDLVDFVGKVWPGKTTFPDWFHPDTQAYWTKYITEWCRQVPLDGIWIDMNEAASFHDGDCSHIESSEDRPVRPSDFALAEPEDSDAEGGRVLQPQHQQQPQHADSDPRKKHDQPKEAIAHHEREYEQEHDPHYLEKGDSPSTLQSSGNPDLDNDEDTLLPSEPRSPVVYARPNHPPYKINNNNEHADLEYRTISPDALHHGGVTEYDAHNLYGHMEAIATYNAIRSINPEKKPFVLSRSTFPGSGQFVSKWNGDNWSTEYDMKASIAGLLNFQFFGISMIGADIGGFGDAAKEELLIRWHQLGAFYPFMRNHNCITNPPQEPYISKSLVEVSRNYLDMRYRLLPYWYTLFFRSHQDGRMVCSPLWILDPTDQDLLSNDEQFLVGESILVSPALKLGQDVVKVRFPAGRWYDIHSGILEAYIESEEKVSQGQSGNSKVLAVDAPLNKIPVHLRGGHILPRAGIEAGVFIGTTSQVRKAPLQVLVALNETECAEGEFYHDDDSFAAADGTLVKFQARAGLLNVSSISAKCLDDTIAPDGKERADSASDVLVPFGSRNLRSTFIESVLVWGVGIGQVESSKILKAGTVSSSCQVESRQVRISVVKRVAASTESAQHRRELSAVPSEEVAVVWDASKAQLTIKFQRTGGFEIQGDQALEVDWTEALVAHDPFHGLFAPPPSSDFNVIPKRTRTVNIPHFVKHLISKHHQHPMHSSKDNTAKLSAHLNNIDHNEHSHDHDHSLHEPGHCRQSMRIENSLCDYDAVEVVNQEMKKQLHSLVQQKYFKFYKLNLYGTCPFWTENHLCMNKDCGVSVVDETTIPQEWTSAALGAISSPLSGMNFQPFKSCQLKDQDFCQVDDEAISEGVYVDLVENPERFTGYSGPSAAKVWDAIYNENCFNIAQQMQLASDCEQCSLDRQADEELLAGALKNAAMTGISLARNPIADVEMDRLATRKDSTAAPVSYEPVNPLTAGVNQDEDVCLEKRVFYRMISGLHASISIHICDEHFNQTSGVWGPNLDCFVSRVGAHPDRLENIYFDYAILVRAVTKLSGYLKDYEFCTGNPEEDANVKAMVDRLIDTSTKSPAIFDEKAMFIGPEAQALKLEFRDHFRNITKIMDCVGCEKCRLWGKVQTSGLGTALKVLFSYNDEHLNPIKNPNLLQRTEIVALFNTLNRFSESVDSITKFREMYMKQFGPRGAPTTNPAFSSERQQHPAASEPVSTTADENTQPSTTAASIMPFFTSVLESHTTQPARDHTPSPPTGPTPSSYSIELHWSRAKTLLQEAHGWMKKKSFVLNNMVLEVYTTHFIFINSSQKQSKEPTSKKAVASKATSSLKFQVDE